MKTLYDAIKTKSDLDLYTAFVMFVLHVILSTFKIFLQYIAKWAPVKKYVYSLSLSKHFSCDGKQNLNV